MSWSGPAKEETCDIYLLPPEGDPEVCKDWIRLRLRDGRYRCERASSTKFLLRFPLQRSCYLA